VDVSFDPLLRGETEQAVARLHELFNSGITPPAVREPKCESCSLERICLPDALDKRRSASGYLSALIREAEAAVKREGTQP
jgi:CRISPR-associated exonuclease Cas4